MNEPSITRPGWRKLPASAMGVVMPLLLSIFMTFIVSAVATMRAIGLAPDFVERWMSAWGLSSVIAFPAVLVVLPIVRRLAALIVETPKP